MAICSVSGCGAQAVESGPWGAWCAAHAIPWTWLVNETCGRPATTLHATTLHEQLEARVKALEEHVVEVTSAHDGLSDEIDSLTGEFAALMARVDMLEDLRCELRARGDHTSSRVDALARAATACEDASLDSASPCVGRVENMAHPPRRLCTAHARARLDAAEARKVATLEPRYLPAACVVLSAIVVLATLANLAAEWGPVALEAAWTAVAALASLAGGGR